MKNKTLLWAGIYAVVGYGVYYKFFSKTAYINKIIKAGKYGKAGGNISALRSFDYGFLKSWGSAAAKNEEFFYYKNVKYKTQGGATPK